MSRKLGRRKGVVSAADSGQDSPDWDSPSTATGTVKRRPLSSEFWTEIRDTGTPTIGRFKRKFDFKHDTLIPRSGHESRRIDSTFGVAKNAATIPAGKVSDSDSGIASPLSPSSLYGFPLCYQNPGKSEEKRTEIELGFQERNKKRSLPSLSHNIQVKYVSRVLDAKLTSSFETVQRNK